LNPGERRIYGVETCDVGEPGHSRNVQSDRQQDRLDQRSPTPVDEVPRQPPPAQLRPGVLGDGHAWRRHLLSATAKWLINVEKLSAHVVFGLDAGGSAGVTGAPFAAD
jgi:hypothetical protein